MRNFDPLQLVLALLRMQQEQQSQAQGFDLRSRELAQQMRRDRNSERADKRRFDYQQATDERRFANEEADLGFRRDAHRDGQAYRALQNQFAQQQLRQQNQGQLMEALGRYGLPMNEMGMPDPGPMQQYLQQQGLPAELFAQPVNQEQQRAIQIMQQLQQK